MAETKKKLPDEEWQFSEIDSDLVGMAFYYEYARQSKKITCLVKLYRKVLGYYVQNQRDGTWAPAPDLSEEQNADRIEKESLFKKDESATILAWLGMCKGFPSKPFIKLNPTEYRNECDIFHNLPGLLDMGHCWLENLNEDSFPYLLESKPQQVDCHRTITAHVMCFDWRKTDSELKNEFSDWLQYTRQGLRVNPSHELKRGLFNRVLELPEECKKMDTALAHLGKLRCRNHAGSWEQYLAIYCKPDANLRYLERDISAAKRVLAWMESVFCSPA